MIAHQQVEEPVPQVVQGVLIDGGEEALQDQKKARGLGQLPSEAVAAFGSVNWSERNAGAP